MKVYGLASFALLGCGLSKDPPQLAETSSNLNGLEGAFDYSIDMPWRMEPRFDAQNHRSYDPIPITITILDEDTNAYSQDLLSDERRLGRFCGMSVAQVDFEGQIGPKTHILPRELSWIEVTGPGDATHTSYWEIPTAAHPNPLDPPHRICHPGAEDCASLEVLTGTSEWHAQVMLPSPQSGADVTFELVARVTKLGEPCGEDEIALRTYTRVVFASEPLPRFGDGWLYGDLHYHSQSTDNEGESGYAYRAVATTLATMGVDFVFATDHASDSKQIVDIDPWFGGGDVEKFRGLRDLNQRRWDAALHLLHDVGGANAEGAKLAAGRPRLPRVFLGAEVDVIPEVPIRPGTDDVNDPDWLVPYGNGLAWNMIGEEDGLCSGWVVPGNCPMLDFFTPFTDAAGNQAFAVHDTQGLDLHAFARQHLLYLPRFRDQPTGFVGSRTTTYGGASRSVDNVLDEVNQKHGIAFLAHPLSRGGAGKGPGFLPFTQYQYEKIFSHPGLVGLQLWNEDSRVYSKCNAVIGCEGDFGQTGYDATNLISNGGFSPGYDAGSFTFTPVNDVGAWTWTGAEHPESGLHHGAAQWDKLLRWGLDLGRTSAIPWLPAGEPRRMFMAGGSDAHGDFNYRREGYVTLPDKVTDTAIAKVRNLVEVGPVRGPCSAVDPKCGKIEPHAPGHSQDQIVEALAAGRFAVTDGPALRMVIDRNRNQQIDAKDYPMGSVIDLYPGDDVLPILIEAKTNGELGSISKIDLYVGVDVAPSACAGPSCGEVRARTYAPPDHGVRGSHEATRTLEPEPDAPANACGPGICQMADGYWLPANPASLTITGPQIQHQHGVWKVDLNPALFPTSDARFPVPTRLYVRAFAKTTAPCATEGADGKFRANCAPGYAFTNPIWAVRQKLTAGQACPFSDRALDRDYDGFPDACDQFPDQAGGGWTRAFGGAQIDAARATAIDADGNLFAVGSIQNGAVRFEGATGVLSAQNVDGVVVKYSATGQVLLRKQLTGSGMQQIDDIAITNGAIYITGRIQGFTTPAPFPDVTPASVDVFVARLRSDDLSIQWIKYLDGAGDAVARSVAVSATGQVAIAGEFSGSGLPFYPAAQGTTDCFLAFFAAATGQLQAIQTIDGTGGCSGRDLVIDPATGRTTMAIAYDGAVRVSSTITRTTAGRDTAIVRFGNASEAFAPSWATFVGSQLATGDASVNTLVLAADKTLYGGGDFTGQLAVTGTQWGGATTTLATSQAGTDGYVVHLDDLGRALASPLPTAPGSGNDAITALAFDASSRLIVTGQFTSTELALGSTTLPREGLLQNAFVAWISPAGQAVQARRFSTNTGHIIGNNLVVTPSGDAAATFTFTGTGKFDDTRSVTAAGGFDGALTVQKAPGP